MLGIPDSYRPVGRCALRTRDIVSTAADRLDQLFEWLWAETANGAGQRSRERGVSISRESSTRHWRGTGESREQLRRPRGGRRSWRRSSAVGRICSRDEDQPGPDEVDVAAESTAHGCRCCRCERPASTPRRRPLRRLRRRASRSISSTIARRSSSSTVTIASTSVRRAVACRAR